MLEGDEERDVTIPGARVERLTASIALATAEAFDEAILHLGDEARDEVGLLEEALRMFFGELRDAKQTGQVAVEELITAKQDLEQKLETIQRQQDAIKELSAPILEVWEGVLSLPVIGALDTERAIDMTERLLRRVAALRARWVLVDLTGLAGVDLAAVDHLLRLARALRMLGCRCVVTGVRPGVAAALVDAREELRDLRPMRSLREGLKYCLKERSNGYR